MKRNNMYTSALVKAKAINVGQFDALNEVGQLVSELTPDELAAPGFYFFSHRGKGIVVARFYIGRQRSKSGLRNIASQIRTRRSNVGNRIMDGATVYDIFFIPVDKMKTLTTAFGKGKLGTLLSRAHVTQYQNLEEMNRMLNDHFKFYSQNY